jgi:exodeoxyribonuclease-5
LGDPFQLPTINPADDNHLLDHPHVFLDEVHRQAQESEIIRLSMDIRAQKSLELFDGHDVKVYNRDDLSTGMLMWADQILCGTNNTRIGINTQMRDLLGREGGPQDGDKVIALRNEWDTLSVEHEPLVNGTIGVLQNSYSTTRSYPRYILNGGTFKVLHSDFYTDGDATYTDLNMDQVMIETGEKCCSRELEYKLNKNPRTRGIVPLEFTYGYAITTHKAQGSQWPNVLVVEERFPFDKTEHARWLYTACTRAEERLVLIRK